MTEVFKGTPQAECILGVAGTGKTEELIKRVKASLDQGIEPSDCTILCASSDAVTVVKSRLADHVPSDSILNAITITTPQELALTILSEKEALVYTGREPRILSAFEMNFLLEDMKVGGLRPRRLREILKFFYRGWTELADDDPSWLFSGEELDTHHLLKENLAFMQALIMPELSNLAVNYLRNCTNSLEGHAVSHLFIDDYQCLNRASQVLANMIARDSITIAGHGSESIEVSDPYPYSAGLEEFKQINTHAKETILETSFLSKAVTSSANKLLADDSMGVRSFPCLSTLASEGSFSTLIHASFSEEFDDLANFVSTKISEGIEAADIFIVVPNKVWNAKVAAALCANALKVDALADKEVLSGDIRDHERSSSMRIYTALRLVANPGDAVAWRSWCGFGDYLTNSAIFSKLRAFASAEGLSLVEALAKIDEDPHLISGAEKVVTAYRAGKALVSKVSGVEGRDLVKGLTAIISAGAEEKAPLVLETLCEPYTSNDTAQIIAERASRNLIFPHYTQSADAIKIGSSRHLCGLSPKLLVYSGFVNGFIPDRDYFDGTKTTLEKKESIHKQDTRSLYTAIGKATEDIVFSYFTKADLESAEILGLEIERIRLENGKRMCTISPSEFLATLQD